MTSHSDPALEPSLLWKKCLDQLPSKEPKNFLVYRDRLIPRSEISFMKRQYIGFRELKPHWVGCKMDEGLAESDIKPLLIGGNGLFAWSSRVLFKQAGIVPAMPELKRIHPELVHAQFGRGGALALPLARKLDIPLVVTFHGGDAFKEKHYRRRVFRPVLGRRWHALMSYASLIVCVSEGIREKLIERGAPEPKLQVIHIGADNILDRIPDQGPEHFLFAGRFVEKKGIFILLSAIEKMRLAGNTVPFVLAGDGPLLKVAMEKARDLTGVHFSGWMSSAELKKVIRKAYAVVIPSIIGKKGDKEGLPSVSVEAMACGIPIIASDDAGLNDILKENSAGLLAKAGDPDALVNHMLALSADPLRRLRMAQASLDLARTRFSAMLQSRLLEERLLSVL
jgi:glycosyltransferase involved in cell wall biosynthesis